MHYTENQLPPGLTSKWSH